MSAPMLFLDAPLSFEQDGGVVFVTAVSGAERLCGAMSIHNLIASYANAGKIVRDWQGGAVTPLKGTS